MPRLLKTATAERRRLTADRYRPRRVSTWVDPYPEVHGTLPEKMVYAELSRLGIPFLFLNDIRFTIPEIEFDKEYQADFVIPSLKLIIEVQGAYWHTMDKTIEADAFKFAIYETAGYKVLAWWDFDIIEGIHNLVFAEPSLLAAATSIAPRGRSTELPVQSRKKQNTSKGIVTLNTRRRASKQPRTSRRGITKAKASYAL